MEPRLLQDGEEVQLWHLPRETDVTIVVFTHGVEGAEEEMLRWAERLARAHGHDCLALVPRRANWFPRRAMAPLLDPAQAAARPRRITFGLGAGGHGALKYGAALGADAALAIAPQASIEPAVVPFDPRFRRLFDPAAHAGMAIGPADAPPAALVAFDPGDRFEAGHARLLAAVLPGIVLAPMRSAGAGPLAVAGGAPGIAAMLGLALEGRIAAIPALLRRQRRASPLLLGHLGAAQEARGRPALAARLRARAQELGLPAARLEELRRHAHRHRLPPRTPGRQGGEAAAAAAVAAAALRAATRALASGDAAAALDGFREALARDPANEAAHLGLNDALSRQGLEEEAMAAARDALLRLPDSPRLWSRLGWLLLRRSLPAEAERAFRRALTLDPRAQDPRLGLIETLIRQDRPGAAEAAAREAAAALPEAPRLRLRLGHLLLPADPAGAEAEFRAALALDRPPEAARTGLVNALTRQGRREEAVAVAQAAAEAAADDPEALARAARLLLDLDELPGAEAALQRALDLKEELPLAHLGLCEVRRRQKRIKEAVAAIRRAEALGVDRALLRAQRVRLYGDPGPD